MNCFYILNIIVYFGWQYHLEMLLPFSRLSFHFCDGLISCSKDFKFNLLNFNLFILFLLP